MAEYSPEENARRLKAWNAWKEVCWVHGLGKPRGELPIVGTAEDEKLLSDMISNAFRRQLEPFRAQFEDNDGRFCFPAIDCAQEFDSALHEYECADRLDKRFRGGQPKFRVKKAWKDVVWQSISESEDHPLKVIIGKLLGTSGVIDQIVDEWLLANYSCRFKGEMLVFHHSRDAAVEGRGEKASDDGDAEGYDPNEMTVMETISPESPDASGDEEIDSGGALSSDTEAIAVPASWKDELENAFSPCMCCLILAHINGVKLYADKEALDTLGIGKTTAANELNNSAKCLSNLHPELRDWILNDDAGTRFFRKWIESRCRAEKAGQLILSRIESKNAEAK